MRALARRLPALVALALAAACTARTASGPGVGERLAPRAFGLLDGTGDIQVPAPGRVVVLNLWATWCEPCRREMPSLERLHRKLAPAGVAVVGISVDEDRNLAREFLRAGGLTFPNAGGSARELARGDLRIARFPTTLVIDAAGVVRWREERSRDWSSAESLARLDAVVRAGAGGR